jgi:hypothetical protein
VRKYNDYLQHAAECREMARSASPTHRSQLEQMAEVWEELAEARKRKLEKEGISVDADPGGIRIVPHPWSVEVYTTAAPVYLRCTVVKQPP